jgi:hypothetical protein
MKVPSIGIENNLSMIVSGHPCWKVEKTTILFLRETIKGDASKRNLASANKGIVANIQTIVLL